MVATSARRTGILTKTVVGFLLALLLFATMGVNQAQATSNAYKLQRTFPGGECTGLHNSGQRDGNGNVYVPCGNPSTVRVFDPAGNQVKSIALGFYATDVAPSWDGNVLYAAQFKPESAPNAGDGSAVAIRRLTKDAATGNYAINEGANWSLKPYSKDGGTYKAKGAKIATDSKGNLYVADGAGGNTDVQGDEMATIVKHDAAGNVLTHFGGSIKNGAGYPFYGLLGGIAVSEDGNRVYAVEGNNEAGPVGNKGNHLFRFDKQTGSDAYTLQKKWGKDTVKDKECVYHGEIGDVFSAWNEGYFAAPWDIETDADENLYVVSASCREVMKFDSEFNFRVGMKIGGVTDEPFNQGKPHGIAVSAAGEVYIGQANAKMYLADAETVRPTATVAPASGAEGSLVGGNVTAAFSEPMMPGNMTFVLKNAAGTEVASAMSYNKATKTATLDPNADLAANTSYTAILTGAKDHWGNLNNPNPLSWTFKTGGGPTLPDVTCLGKAANVVGNDNGENLSGTDNGRDVIAALGGADTMRNVKDLDTACGGDGNDTFVVVDDDIGTATLDGGDGDSRDDSSDAVNYSAVIRQGVSVNLSYHPYYNTNNLGYAETRSLSMQQTLDNISDVSGTEHADSIVGDKMRNSLYGGGGNDSIVGGAEAAGASGDFISGEAGNDTIKVRDGSKDKVDCGEGDDDRVEVDANSLDTVVNCETIIYPETVKPVVKAVSPKPGSSIRNRTPTIRATATDDVTDLAKGDIELYVGTTRGTTLISPTKYTYDASSDTLVYNSPRLPAGKTTVRVVAKDGAGNVGALSWGFTIRR